MLFDGSILGYGVEGSEMDGTDGAKKVKTTPISIQTGDHRAQDREVSRQYVVNYVHSTTITNEPTVPDAKSHHPKFDPRKTNEN